TTFMPPISRPKINSMTIVIPTVRARDRCPISQYPDPGTTHVARATMGTGTELEAVEAIVGDYSNSAQSHCNEVIDERLGECFQILLIVSWNDLTPVDAPSAVQQSAAARLANLPACSSGI